MTRADLQFWRVVQARCEVAAMKRCHAHNALVATYRSRVLPTTTLAIVSARFRTNILRTTWNVGGE